MPYLHLPVQSGSDRILKAMNRSHTRRKLSADCIEQGPRRAARHRASRGDFIVGFPGETEADFEDDAAHRRRGRLRVGLFVQIFAPPGHAGGDDGRSRSRAEVMDERLQRLQAALSRASARLQPRERRQATRDDPDRAQGPQARPDDRQVAVAAVGPSSRPTRRSATCVDVDLVTRRPEQPWPARCARAGRRLMAKRDLAAVAANDEAAPGSSSSSSSPICSGPCSAITTATWSRSRTASACTSPRAATGCRSRASPTPRRAPATC